MNRKLLSIGASAIAFAGLAAGLTGAAAQESTTDSTTTPSTTESSAHPGHGHGHHRGGIKGVDKAELATFLGVDEATLKTSLQGGASLASIAADAGKSRDELIAFLTSSVTASLSEKVAAGDITQAQADERLAKFTENVDEMIDKVRVPGEKPMKGPRGMGAAESSSSAS